MAALAEDLSRPGATRSSDDMPAESSHFRDGSKGFRFGNDHIGGGEGHV